MKVITIKFEALSLLICLIFNFASAQINYSGLLQYFARQNNVILPSSCSSVLQYRSDCTRRCTDINLPTLYCPPNTRRLACHRCFFPNGYTSSRGQCVSAAICRIVENPILNPSLATLTATGPTTVTTNTITTRTTTTPRVIPQTPPSIVRPAPTISILPGNRRCGGNRVYTNCATCDFFCHQRLTGVCNHGCRVGCACAPNHFLDSSGSCIAAELCPSINVVNPSTPSLPGFAPIGFAPIPSTADAFAAGASTVAPSTVAPSFGCPGSLIPSNCVCDRTCENPTRDCRSLTCSRGCTCPEGTYRNGANCLTATQCSFVNPRTPPNFPSTTPIATTTTTVAANTVCPESFEFSSCIECERTCANRFDNIACTPPCTPGCVCQQGYRDGNRCVSLNECTSMGVNAFAFCGRECPAGQQCRRVGEAFNFQCAP